MSPNTLLVLALFCNAMVLVLPIYLVALRARFWFGFFAAWFFLVAAESYSVDRGWALHNYGEPPPADGTNVGILIVSGWILALPYCLLLIFVRRVLRRYNLVRPLKGEQSSDDKPDPVSS